MMLPIDGQPILTAAQMRAAEAASGIAPYDLMERAGAGVAAAVARLAAGAEVLILCGPGNNGGDGYVAARVLGANGVPVRVAAVMEAATDLARRARAGWTGPVDMSGGDSAPVLVDAMFGTGLSHPLGSTHAAVLRMHCDRARLAIAVDLPSGVESDTGAFQGDLPTVDLTLALGALKPAHLLHPAAALCGDLRLIPLGLDLPRDVTASSRPHLIDPRPADHKFTRGMVAVIAGAMPGAAALASIAAARAGAGYVLLLGASTDRLPHAIVRRRWSADALADERIGAVLIGPGLGRDDRARERLTAALASGHPLVIDGDALHLLDEKTLDDLRQRPNGDVVLTPHAGEFRAVFGEPRDNKIEATRRAAERAGAVIVHKGPDTVIAAPGGPTQVSGSASAWLSTAGTGDVLAGTIAAQLSTGLPVFDAAAAGVWLHAEAARRCGASFIADDLAHALTAARAQVGMGL